MALARRNFKKISENIGMVFLYDGENDISGNGIINFGMFYKH